MKSFLKITFQIVELVQPILLLATVFLVIGWSGGYINEALAERAYLPAVGLLLIINGCVHILVKRMREDVQDKTK